MSGKNGVWIPFAACLLLAVGLWAGYLLAGGDRMTDGQRKLARVLEIIDNEYVDIVDTDSVMEASLPLLLQNLDPHSVYIAAADRADTNQKLDGSFSGIGIQFQIMNDTVCVVEVISGGPGERVGLQAGDRILSVDSVDITGDMAVQSEVFSRLRGPRGTHVQVAVRRNGASRPLQFDIVRDQVPLVSIDAAYMLNDSTGYIKVNTFGRNTYTEFLQAMHDLRRSGAEAYIIDLRGNTGGYMEPAIMMVNELLPGGRVIVATRGRRPSDGDVVVSDGTGSFDDVPVAVLIDEFTASSSEIFSGAIQDNDRGVIIGRRSFGKGLVQHPFELPDSSELRLTVQRYYTPSGRCIQKDYVPGDNESYEAEILDRYNNGEILSADSVHLKTDEVYTTMAGRTVYGGGGIMPDVFVPSDTAGVNKFYLELANDGLLQSFAYEYADLNRADLEASGDVAGLLARLPSDNVLLASFAAYARQNGVRIRYYYLNNSRRLIVRQLKALIARDVLGIQAYYEIDNTEDSVVREAARQIGVGKAGPHMPAVN